MFFVSFIIFILLIVLSFFHISDFFFVAINKFKLNIFFELCISCIKLFTTIAFSKVHIFKNFDANVASLSLKVCNFNTKNKVIRQHFNIFFKFQTRETSIFVGQKIVGLCRE